MSEPSTGPPEGKLEPKPAGSNTLLPQYPWPRLPSQPILKREGWKQTLGAGLVKVLVFYLLFGENWEIGEVK